MYISIGTNCDVANFLRSRGLRREAMPFDWNVCGLDRITNCIETDFVDWMSDLVKLEEVTDREMESLALQRNDIMYCKKTGILFRHDFTHGEHKEDETRQKYQRRIQRFRDACESGGPITFVADYERPYEKNSRNVKLLKTVAPDERITPTSSDIEVQVARFSEAIRRKFPKLVFSVRRLRGTTLI